MEKNKQATKILMDYKKKHKMSYDALAEKVGITKVTILKRVKLNNWTIAERYFIVNALKKKK